MNRISRCVWLGFALGQAWAAVVTGGRNAAAEELAYPLSIAVDRAGVVYLADRDLPGVWRLEGDRLSVLFQGAKKHRTPLNAVRCVASDADGRVLAGDSATREVYRLDQGKPQPLTAPGKPFGQVGIPMDIVVDSQGDLFVSDLETQRIVKIPKAGGPAAPFASVPAPRGLFCDAKNRLWILSGRRLLRLSPGGERETLVEDGFFQFPHTIVVEENNTAYVCDGFAKTIWKVPPSEKPIKWVSGAPLVNPVGLELFKDKWLVADPHAKAVFEIDRQGKLTRREAKPAPR